MKLILPILLLVSSIYFGQSKKFIRNIESIDLSYDASRLHNSSSVTFTVNVHTLLGESFNSATSHKVKMHQYDVKCAGPIKHIKENHKVFTLSFNSDIDTSETLVIFVRLKKDTSINYRLEIPVVDFKNEIESIELAYSQSSAYAGNTVNFDVISYLKSGEIIRTGLGEKRILNSDFNFAVNGPANLVETALIKSITTIRLHYNSFTRNHPVVSAILKRNSNVFVERMVPISYGVNYELKSQGRSGYRGSEGRDGSCGSNGSKYSGCELDGQDGYDGDNGEDGDSGFNGRNAPNTIVRYSVELNDRGEQCLLAEVSTGTNGAYKRYISFDSGSITIYAQGGRGGIGGEGGDGGNGGCGGKGYKPSESLDKKRGRGGRGGDGGNGGDGGDGGNGGNGGDVLIQYTKEAAGYLSKINVVNDGGSGGRGGSSGSRGCKGNAGTGATCGKDGVRGYHGDNGRAGYGGTSGQVTFIQLD